MGLHPRLLPVRVEARAGSDPGDIHVDAIARYLYHIQPDGTAMRYGVAIGRSGLYEPGTYTVGRKAKWPRWTPTPQMIEREPEVYAQYSDGMDPVLATRSGRGRCTCSLAAVIPIFASTARRCRGPSAAGPVRLRAHGMPHIIDLYDQVQTGVTAHLYPAEEGKRGTDGLNMITVKSKHFTLRTPKAGRFPARSVLGDPRCWRSP